MAVSQINTQAPPAKSAPADRLKAIGLICAAGVLFSCLDAAAKYLVGPKGMPLEQVVGMRFAANVLVVLILLPLLSGAGALYRATRSSKLLHQLVRSFLMFGSTALNFVAIKYLQLDQTITIFFVTPLLVAGLAGPLLGEWVGWRRWFAIATGFLGVLLVTKTGFGGIHWAAFFSLGAALCYSLYNISTRYLSRFDSTQVTLFYTPVVGFVLLAPVIVLSWQWPDSLLDWLLLFAVGFLGGAGHWLLIIAHRLAPASVLAPFVYVNLISMVALGFLAFGDVPTLWTLSGGMVVIASGLYLLYRERARAKAEAKAAAVVAERE